MRDRESAVRYDYHDKHVQPCDEPHDEEAVRWTLHPGHGTGTQHYAIYVWSKQVRAGQTTSDN